MDGPEDLFPSRDDREDGDDDSSGRDLDGEDDEGTAEDGGPFGSSAQRVTKGPDRSELREEGLSDVGNPHVPPIDSDASPYPPKGPPEALAREDGRLEVAGKD